MRAPPLTRRLHPAPHPCGISKPGLIGNALQFRAQAVAFNLEVADVVAKGGDKEVDLAVTALSVFAKPPRIARQVTKTTPHDFGP